MRTSSFMKMLPTGLALMCLAGCGGGDGVYSGVATEKTGSSRTQTQETVRLLRSSKAGVDMYLEGMTLPCGELPLKKSGSSYSLKGSVDCDSTYQSGSGSRTTTSNSVSEVEVSVTGKSLTVNAKYTKQTGGSTEYQVDFDGEFAGTN